MNYAIAIDIGGTNTRVALVNEDYVIEERVQFPTDPRSPYNTIEEIRKAIEGFGKQAKGIGISCPGPLDLIHGYILTTTNLEKEWDIYRNGEGLLRKRSGQDLHHQGHQKADGERREER